MRLLMLLFYLVLIIIGVTFAAINASDVQVNFYVTSFRLPMSILMVIVLGVGVLIGFIIFSLRYWRLKREYKKLKSQLNLTEKEIKNLRAIPLKDQH